jgi:proteasome lid subunit RPN8/RPN11
VIAAMLATVALPSPCGAVGLGLTPAVLREVFGRALAAYPQECCGYVCAAPSEVYALPLAAPTGSRFAIDDVAELARLDQHTAAARRADSRVVFYHSHPDGRAHWSRVDDQAWTTSLGPTWDVDHLVVAVSSRAVLGAVLVRWHPDRGRFVEVDRWTGVWP